MSKSKKIVLLASSKSFLDSRKQLISRLVASGHHVSCIVPDSLLESPFNDYGAEFYGIPLQKSGLNPVSDLLFLLKLVKFFARLKPDLVLGYTIKPVIYGCLAARLTNVKDLFAVIPGLGYAFGKDSKHQRLAGYLARKLYRQALKFCKKVIFQNPDDLNEFLSLRIVRNEQCLLVNGSGVDLEYFSLTPPPQNSAPVFVLIARMLKEKGIMEFLAAAKEIRNEFPLVGFKLIGPCENGPSAIEEEKIKKISQENNVDYLGRTSDVRPFLVEGSVFVLPTYYREGVPRIILEALATGRAIITTDMPGCRETVVNDENGFLIKPRSVDSLVDAMKKFINDQSLAVRMGKKSRKLAEEKFDVHRVNDVMLQQLGLVES